MSARDDHLERLVYPAIARPDDDPQVIFLKADPLAGQPESPSSGQLMHSQAQAMRTKLN
jgi:hypothetical protein